MSRPSPAAIVVRALPAVALMLAAMLVAGTCTGANLGVLSDPPPGGGGGGGGGGGKPPGPAVPPIDGGLSRAGRPVLREMAPAAGSTQIDVLAPIAVWFSESVNLATVNSLALQLRPKGAAGSIAYGVRGYCGDRLVVLTPTSNLLAATTYELYVTNALTDLAGARIDPPKQGFVGSFRTAPVTSGVAPRVLGSYPPDGSSQAPNDHSVVLVFSKPIDLTSVSGAVELTAGGLPAAYGIPAGHSSNRVVEFAHLDDELDLGAAMALAVSTDITDIEFVPNHLAAPFAAAWTTLALARPAGIDIGGEPAVNLGNLAAFPTNLAVSASVLASDTARLEIWEGLGGDSVAAAAPAVAGPGSVAFVSDLSDAAGAPRLADGLLTIGASLARGGLRTTFRVEQSFFQDTVRPSLVRFGPPVSSIPSRFATDLPELRPYGIASETISAVAIEFPPNAPSTRTTALPSPNKFFLGDSFPVASVAAGPFPFTALLTDAAGNAMQVAVSGSAVFRGFTGPDPAAGELTVAAFNGRTLEPIAGATVYVQNATGSADEDSGTTGSGGSILFDDAALPGARTGAQTVTILHASFHTVTVAGVDSSLLSVPLREKVPPTKTVAPQVGGVVGGIGRFFSPLLMLDSATSDPDSQRDEDLPLAFSSLTVLSDRPGWFGAFHDVAGYGGDPVTGRYFERFAIDPRLLIDAIDGSGSGTVQPILEMVPSSYAGIASSDWIYPVGLSFGANFDPPAADKSLAHVAVIPGMVGVATTGAGAISGSAGGAELEQALLALATAEGAAAGVTLVQLWAEDSDGDQLLQRVERPAAASPGLTTVVAPDISLPLGPSGVLTWPAVALAFTDTLTGGGDWYRLVLSDNDLTPRQWEIWLPGGATAGSFDLPSLKPDPVSPADDPPLLTDPGNEWTLQVETFSMPAGSLPAGVFFRQLRRDNLGWTRSMPGTAFSVVLP